MFLLFTTRASSSFNIIIVVLAILLPLLLYSIYIVKYKKNYKKHQLLQTIISLSLFLVLLFFEIDIQINDWKARAIVSPYYDSYLFPTLYIHLFFSITTLIVWMLTLFLAYKKFKVLSPNSHSKLHKRLGKLAVLGLFMTTITGYIFYYLAFIA